MILVINFVLTQEVYSQARKKQNSLLIANIEKTIQETKYNLDSFQKIEKINDTSSYRQIYKQGKELKLISIENKDMRDSGKYIDKKVEWYFSNGQLIYSEQIWTDITTDKIIDTQKFYLHDQHLISWIKIENKIVDDTSQEFKDFDAEMTAYEIKLKKSAE